MKKLLTKTFQLIKKEPVRAPTGLRDDGRAVPLGHDFQNIPRDLPVLDLSRVLFLRSRC